MNRLSMPLTSRDHFQGPRDAPLELVEYGDYECPHCKAAYPAVKQLQAEFDKNLRFAYRHFPLVEIHPLAEPAAEAAEAAGAQAKFWQMHDLLFQYSPRLEAANLLAIAAEIDIDIRRFGYELATHRHLPRVRDDIESGTNSGVRGTPTFFVNGVHHEGGYDFESLREALLAMQHVG
jgi:protein-disulfide isomerase